MKEGVVTVECEKTERPYSFVGGLEKSEQCRPVLCVREQKAEGRRRTVLKVESVRV